MKYTKTQLAIFLLLGAVINITLAWSCAAWSTNFTDKSVDYYFASNQLHWGKFKVDLVLLEDLGWPLPPEKNSKAWEDLYVTSSIGFGLEYQDVNISQISGCFVFMDRIVNNISSGWPCLALEGVRLKHAQSSAVPEYTNHWLIETPLQAEKEYWIEPRCLPYHPIWPGFAINTLIYATFLCMLTLGPFKLRQHIRSKRGSCLKCGYDLNHADHRACPECGTPIC